MFDRDALLNAATRALASLGAEVRLFADAENCVRRREPGEPCAQNGATPADAARLPFVIEVQGLPNLMHELAHVVLLGKVEKDHGTPYAKIPFDMTTPDGRRLLLEELACCVASASFHPGSDADAQAWFAEQVGIQGCFFGFESDPRGTQGQHGQHGIVAAIAREVKSHRPELAATIDRAHVRVAIALTAAGAPPEVALPPRRFDFDRGWSALVAATGESDSAAPHPWSDAMTFARAISLTAVLSSAPLFAQGDPKAPPAAASPADRELQAAVELCFSITDEKQAAAKIAEVAAGNAADPEKLLRAIKTPPPRSTEAKFQVSVPFEGIAYPVAVVPPKKKSDAPPPVLFDVSFNSTSRFPFETPVLCSVDQYTPEQFSDASRDSWRKMLHAVSFAVGGDPDRFWFMGFSWGGHAGFDVAAHRPGLLRGFVSLAGGPRRNHFRLMPNLAPTRILSFAGAKDDAEMLWNVKELARLAPSLKLDVKFTLDPAQGHTLPLQGMDEVVALIDSTAATPPSLPKSGALFADGDKVALPWLEIVEVIRSAVEIPDAIPVDGSRSKDEQRREVIQKMADHVARVTWKSEPAKGGGLALALHGSGVKRAAIFVKAPWFDPSQELHITANGKKVFDGPIKIDPAALLSEARRTGDRQRPTLMRIEADFGR